MGIGRLSYLLLWQHGLAMLLSNRELTRRWRGVIRGDLVPWNGFPGKKRAGQFDTRL